MPSAPELVHGTAVAYGDLAALILGPSGAGKSDLALRCLTLGPSPMLRAPVRLVGDDYVHISRAGNVLDVKAPDTIFGKLEVRGIGIVEVDALREARLAVVVELVDMGDVERLPDRELSEEFLGVKVPVMRLHGFESAAASKVLLALRHGGKFGSPS